MDALLHNVTRNAFNYALRTGISITTAYAFKQCTRLLNEAPNSKESHELMLLQARLEAKICILSPAIDMIDLISARGNTSLDSALNLTKDIRSEIQFLGNQLSKAANGEAERKTHKSYTQDRKGHDLTKAIAQIQALLLKIEDAVPLINLAITTSGVNLSTKLSGMISPSRLLQSSTFLSAADGLYAAEPGRRQQVGPTYTVSMYMLFAGHAWRPVDEEGVREATWKEVMHKADLKLFRVPLNEVYDLPAYLESSSFTAYRSIPSESEASEFAYQLVIVENLDDDRYHDEGDLRYGPFEDVQMAGIRDFVPIHEISKIFYADTGKILNIGSEGEANKPVLLLRRDVHADPPRRMMRSPKSEFSKVHSEAEEQPSELDSRVFRESTASSSATGRIHPHQHGEGRLPVDLDPEWMAFEVFTEEQDDEDKNENAEPQVDHRSPADFALADAFSSIRLRSHTPSSPARQPLETPPHKAVQTSPDRPRNVTIKTSLSLLEMLLKLAALQGFRQQTHLSIEDELLNFFLEESSTAGSGPDKDYRARLRQDAVRRVGFDPYDESPIKRRNEAYIRRPQTGSHLAPQLRRHEEARGGEEDEPFPSIENRSASVSPSSLRGLPQSHARTLNPGSAISKLSLRELLDPSHALSPGRDSR